MTPPPPTSMSSATVAKTESYSVETASTNTAQFSSSTASSSRRTSAEVTVGRREEEDRDAGGGAITTSTHAADAHQADVRSTTTKTIQRGTAAAAAAQFSTADPSSSRASAVVVRREEEEDRSPGSTTAADAHQAADVRSTPTTTAIIATPNTNSTGGTSSSGPRRLRTQAEQQRRIIIHSNKNARTSARERIQQTWHQRRLQQQQQQTAPRTNNNNNGNNNGTVVASAAAGTNTNACSTLQAAAAEEAVVVVVSSAADDNNNPTTLLSSSTFAQQQQQHNDGDKGRIDSSKQSRSRTSQDHHDHPALAVSSSSPQPPPPPSSVCHVLRKTWVQIWDEFVLQGRTGKKKPNPSVALEARKNKKNVAMTTTTMTTFSSITANEATGATTTASSSSTCSGKQHSTTTTLFPSVMSILQRHALVRQVQTLEKQQKHLQRQVLSVLPPGYDWNLACRNISQKRSRCFWLLDLATIIRNLVEWKEQKLKNVGGGNSKIRLLYNIHNSSNADAILLRVLLGRQQDESSWGLVGLATTTKWDLQRARQAVNINSNHGHDHKHHHSHHHPIYDDCTVPSKTNGYLRAWIQMHEEEPEYEEEEERGCAAATTAADPTAISTIDDCDGEKAGSQKQPQDVHPPPPKRRRRIRALAVDGPEEVDRICACVQRFLAVRPASATASSCSIHRRPVFELDVMLRLPPNSHKAWMSTVESTWTAIQQERPDAHCHLLGISVDMTGIEAEALQARVEPVLDWLQTKQQRQIIDSTTSCSLLRLDLTGVYTDEDAMLAWWKKLVKVQYPNFLGQITVDATHTLVASAAALCTRIIGVREQQDDSQHRPRRHYYIDDGCYGSLCHPGSSSSKPHCPLPLFATQQQPGTKGRNDIEDMQEESVTYYSTTVWGPTCDGLDQVCKDLPLPKLHRDDWLVFPNVGGGSSSCEGLGTAFNGFDPPDTAYCVLGYFGT